MKAALNLKKLVKKIEKIPQSYKAIFMLVLVIIVVGLLVYFVSKPQWETRDKLQKENDQVQKDLNILREVKKNIEKHRKEYAQMQELLQDVLVKLPETKDVPNLLRNVTTVSEETRLKIKYFEPKELKNKEFYSELPFEIKFSGPFHTVAYFFDGVRKMDRVINITNFNLEAKGTPRNIVLEGTCTANAYVYVREPQKTGKKDDKKADKGGQVEKK
jgi:type IV pilus assembly protein PilO